MAAIRQTESRYGEALQRVWPIAVKRTQGFAEHALLLRVNGQDAIETMLVSAYLQGLDDAAQIKKRREGAYEQER